MPIDKIEELVKTNIFKRTVMDEETIISFQSHYIDTFFKEKIFKTLEFPIISIESKPINQILINPQSSESNSNKSKSNV